MLDGIVPLVLGIGTEPLPVGPTTAVVVLMLALALVMGA